MSTTLNQLTYDLLLKKCGGTISDDEPLSLRQVAYWVMNTRALLIRQDVGAKKRSISDNITQSLGCVPVEYVDAAQCCGLNIGCKILRTVDKIPKPIELDYRDLITRVGPVDITKHPYGLITYNRAQFEGHNRYTKNKPYAFYQNGYVFVVNVPYVKYINVQGVFEDPTEVARFTTCTGEQCYNDDMDFPISKWMVEVMGKMIVDTDIKVMLSVPVDYTNDAKSDPEQQQVKQ